MHNEPIRANATQLADMRVAVVIPSYKVTRHILGVIAAVDARVDTIYVVDDKCPDGSGDLVQRECPDPRVRVILHEENTGVGGAVISGYLQALADGVDIVVKIDGDGQMDPSLLGDFIAPIERGEADYTKGNRFYDLRNVSRMPKIRIFGNAALSFLTKLSSGYWNLFDPTNGYTAIHRNALATLDTDRLSRRYFFETDLLFRLNLARAVVVDIPMDARYEDEVSNLKISKILFEFLGKHIRNFTKRVFYNYFLRDMSAASLELVLGSLLFGFGTIFSLYHWLHSAQLGVNTPTGTIVVGMVAILTGLQLLLAFVNYDVGSVPRRPLQKRHGRS